MRKPIIFAMLLASLLATSHTAYGGQGGGGEKIPGPAKASPKTPPKTPPREARPPRQPTPPRQKTPTVGSLSINSNLPGCTVTLNNKTRGVTDSNGSLFLQSLKPGSYAVTLTKLGYQTGRESINLSAGQSEMLSFELVPVPGTLVVSTNQPGTQIEISNSGRYTDRIDNLSLSPGNYHLTAAKAGYRPITRELEIKSGQTTRVSLTLEAVPVEETLAQAEVAYKNKTFDQVLFLCNQVLTVKPDNAQAHRLVGNSYYSLGRYADGVNSLASAVAFGAQIRLLVTHRHYVFLSGEDLCLGFLTLDKETLSFTSTSKSGHDFSVSLPKVYEVKGSGVGGGRLIVKVLVPKKGGKEDKKEYDYYSSRARTKQVLPRGSKYPTSVIYCDNCEAEIEALRQLLTQVKIGSSIGSRHQPTSTRPQPTSTAKHAGDKHL